MQVQSLAINGLPCIFVGRPTRFGNPFRLETFGLDLSLKLYCNAIHDLWEPLLLHGRSKELFEIADAGHQEFTGRFDVHAVDAIRDELSGNNLSCFCSLSHACHADVLLELITRDPA
jgi:Domain of unknown function (DUF4326)